MKRKNFLKGAVVLLLAVAMVFSSVTVTANTKTKQTVSPTLTTTHEGSGEGNDRGVVWDNGMEYDGICAAQYDESDGIQAGSNSENMADRLISLMDIESIFKLFEGDFIKIGNKFFCG